MNFNSYRWSICWSR